LKTLIFIGVGPIVQRPNFSQYFEITYDATDFTVEDVLGQSVNKISHVIYYASRTLTDSQKNYSTTEKELLVAVFALDKFCFIPFCVQK